MNLPIVAKNVEHRNLGLSVGWFAHYLGQVLRCAVMPTARHTRRLPSMNNRAQQRIVTIVLVIVIAVVLVGALATSL